MDSPSRTTFEAALTRIKPVNLTSILADLFTCKKRMIFPNLVKLAELYGGFWTFDLEKLRAYANHIYTLITSLPDYIPTVKDWLHQVMPTRWRKDGTVIGEERLANEAPFDFSSLSCLFTDFGLDSTSWAKPVVVVLGLVITIGTMMGSGIFMSTTDIGARIAKFATTLGSVTKNSEFILQGFGNFFTMVVSGIGSVFGIQVFDETPREKLIKRIVEKTVEVQAFHNACISDMAGVVSDPKLFENIKKDLKEINDIYVDMAKSEKNLANLKHILDELNRVFKELAVYREHLLAAIVGKQLPVVLWTFGKTGVGKSHFTEYLVKLIGKLEGKRPIIYSRNPTDQFWSGYMGQDIVVYDDFSASVESLDHDELVKIYTANPFPLNMADLADKGKHFTSRYVIICSNVSHVKGSAKLNDPTILDRRRDLLVNMDDPVAMGLRATTHGHTPSSHFKEDWSHLSFLSCSVFPDKDGQLDILEQLTPSGIAKKMVDLQEERREIFVKALQNSQKAFDNTMPLEAMGPKSTLDRIPMMSAPNSVKGSDRGSFGRNIEQWIADTDVAFSDMGFEPKGLTPMTAIDTTKEAPVTMFKPSLLSLQKLEELKSQATLNFPTPTDEERKAAQARVYEYRMKKLAEDAKLKEDYADMDRMLEQTFDESAKGQASGVERSLGALWQDEAHGDELMRCNNNRVPMFLLMGAPGTGKTEILRHVAQVRSAEVQGQDFEPSRVLLIDEIGLNQAHFHSIREIVMGVYDQRQEVASRFDLIVLAGNPSSFERFFEDPEQRGAFYRRFTEVFMFGFKARYALGLGILGVRDIPVRGYDACVSIEQKVAGLKTTQLECENRILNSQTIHESYLIHRQLMELPCKEFQHEVDVDMNGDEFFHFASGPGDLRTLMPQMARIVKIKKGSYMEVLKNTYAIFGRVTSAKVKIQDGLEAAFLFLNNMEVESPFNGLMLLNFKDMSFGVVTATGSPMVIVKRASVEYSVDVDSKEVKKTSGNQVEVTSNPEIPIFLAKYQVKLGADIQNLIGTEIQEHAVALREIPILGPYFEFVDSFLQILKYGAGAYAIYEVVAHAGGSTEETVVSEGKSRFGLAHREKVQSDMRVRIAKILDEAESPEEIEEILCGFLQQFDDESDPRSDKSHAKVAKVKFSYTTRSDNPNWRLKPESDPRSDRSHAKTAKTKFSYGKQQQPTRSDKENWRGEGQLTDDEDDDDHFDPHHTNELKERRKQSRASLEMRDGGVYDHQTRKFTPNLVYEGRRGRFSDIYAGEDTVKRGPTAEPIMYQEAETGNVVYATYPQLSNFHLQEMEVDGQRFASVEHAYQHQKLMHCGHPSLARKVLLARSGAQAKSVGRGFTSKTWDKIKVDVMRRLLCIKFRNVDTLAILRGIEGPLHHRLPDRFWGDLNDQGSNWFGKLLMEVRDAKPPTKVAAPLVVAERVEALKVKSVGAVAKARHGETLQEGLYQISVTDESEIVSDALQDEAMVDNTARMVVHKLPRNTVYIMSGDKICCRGLMIRGLLGVTVAHVVDGKQQICVRSAQGDFKAKVVKEHRNTDTAWFVIEDRTHQAFPDISHFLISRSLDTNDLTDNSAILATVTLESNQIFARCVRIGARTHQLVGMQDKYGLAYRGTCTAYEYEPILTLMGDCGSPLVLCNATRPRKIVSIHNAGAITMGFGSLLFVEDIPKVEEFNNEAPILKSGITILPHQGIDPVEIEDEDRLEGFGRRFVDGKEARGFMSTQTRIWDSPLAAPEIFPKAFEPCVLSPLDPRKTEGAEPYYDAIMKWSAPIPEYDHEVWGEAVEHVATLCSDAIFKTCGPILKVLTVKESINRYSRISTSNPIYRHTSAGYPYKHWEGVKQKDTFFEEVVENDTVIYNIAKNEHGQKLLANVNQLVDAAKRGHRSAVVFDVCLKDEPLKLKKIYTSTKSRSITSSPLDYTIAHRMYMHTAVAALAEARRILPIKVGIDAHSAEWGELYYYLTKKSQIGFDMDYFQWDARVPIFAMQSLPKIYNRIYQVCDPNWKVEDDTVRDSLHSVMHGPLFTFHDSIVKAPGGQVTGQPATAIDNCLINMIYMSYFWKLLAKQHAPSMQSFVRMEENVSYAVYGDDNICMVTPEVREWFNLFTVQEEAAKLNLVATSADKEDNPSKYKVIWELGFLKRGFAYLKDSAGQDTIHVAGPLEKPSIGKALAYTHTNVSHHYWKDVGKVHYDINNMHSVMNSILEECALHGPDFFHQVRSHLLRKSVEIGLTVSLPSYKDQLQATFFK